MKTEYLIKINDEDIRFFNQILGMLRSQDNEQAALAFNLLKTDERRMQLSPLSRYSKCTKKIISFNSYMNLCEDLQEKGQIDWYRPIMFFLTDIVLFNFKDIYIMSYFEHER